MEIVKGQSNIVFDEFNTKYLSAVMAVEDKKDITIKTLIEFQEEIAVKSTVIEITDKSVLTDNVSSVKIPLEMCAQFIKIFSQISEQLQDMEIVPTIIPPDEP